MTGSELITKLEQLDMELPVYISDDSIGSLELYDLEENEASESVMDSQGRFVNFKKIRVILLLR